MKRYECTMNWEHDSDDPIVFRESPDGEWVRAEYALKLQAVVDALPRCDVCGKVATCSGWEAGDYDRDEHTGRYDDLPWADALRAFEGKGQ